MKLIPVNEQVDAIVDEIKSILTETSFTSRWILIEGYHKVGKLLLSLEGNRTELVQQIAVKVERSERTLWYALAFAEKFPVLDKLPEGKLISWRGVIVKYLTSGSDEPHEHDWIPYLCCSCGARKKRDDHKEV